MVYRDSYSLCSIEYTYFQFTVCSLRGEELGEMVKCIVKVVLTSFFCQYTSANILNLKGRLFF